MIDGDLMDDINEAAKNGKQSLSEADRAEAEIQELKETIAFWVEKHEQQQNDKHALLDLIIENRDSLPQEFLLAVDNLFKNVRSLQLQMIGEIKLESCEDTQACISCGHIGKQPQPPVISCCPERRTATLCANIDSLKATVRSLEDQLKSSDLEKIEDLKAYIVNRFSGFLFNENKGEQEHRKLFVIALLERFGVEKVVQLPLETVKQALLELDSYEKESHKTAVCKNT